MSVNMSFTIEATTATELSRAIRELAGIISETARENRIDVATEAPTPAPTTEQTAPQTENLPWDEPQAPEQPSAAAQPSPAASPPPQAPAPQPTVSLEAVRAKLSSLVQAGKKAEVQQLLQSFGVSRLSDVPAERYGELMEKAGALG